MSIHPTARIHDRAIVDDCEIGEETRIWAFAHVLSGAVVGARCNVGESVYVESGVIVGDDCTIKNGISLYEGVTLENRVFVGPNAVFTNVDRPRAGRRVPREQFLATHVGEGATIGANSTIRCGTRIGRFAFVGAGAVVVRDVPDHAIVYGNPARLRGWVCECGSALEKSLSCKGCSRSYAEGPNGLIDG